MIETSPPVDDWEKLRRLAQRLANEHQEAALIVLDPPPSEIHKFQSWTPYVVLTSQARQDEREAAVEAIFPEADEPNYVKQQ